MHKHGFEVTWAASAARAIDIGSRLGVGVPPELVLLDLGLPDGDGVDVCRELRRLLPGAVIVMLTARGAEMDIVVGLDAGADDYLVKPVRLTELVARIRAHLRRNAGAAQDADILRLADLTVDLARRRVLVGHDEITLRTKEFDLLARLVREPGVAVERRTLMSDVWDTNWFGPTKTLDVHVAKVRRALADAVDRSGGVAKVPHIRTLRGHGYRLEP
ncbi:response regulator transcription factor [Pseudonocardia sp. WMMC193]|nr:response regulator transcription factor [Pseudonocardia sp. WMMC193]